MRFSLEESTGENGNPDLDLSQGKGTAKPTDRRFPPSERFESLEVSYRRKSV